MKKLSSIYLKKLSLKNFNPNYYNWVNDKKVNKFLEIRFKKQSKNDVKKFIKYCNNSKNIVLFGIFLEDNNFHIGNIKIFITSRIHKRAEVGLLLGEKKFWGRGYGTKAIKLTTNFAKKKLKLKKLYAGCYEKNIASKKIFLKAGWKIEGFQKSFWKLNSKKRTGEILLGKHFK